MYESENFAGFKTASLNSSWKTKVHPGLSIGSVPVSLQYAVGAAETATAPANITAPIPFLKCI
jgi:hypothetical protein